MLNLGWNTLTVGYSMLTGGYSMLTGGYSMLTGCCNRVFLPKTIIFAVCPPKTTKNIELLYYFMLNWLDIMLFIGYFDSNKKTDCQQLKS